MIFHNFLETSAYISSVIHLFFARCNDQNKLDFMFLCVSGEMRQKFPFKTFNIEFFCQHFFWLNDVYPSVVGLIIDRQIFGIPI